MDAGSKDMWQADDAWMSEDERSTKKSEFQMKDGHEK